ncbi:MAG: ABC transporter substrate-binding protein [Ilumatobacter sp.]
MRIVSLTPSATEIVHALGMEDHLVGVTFECDFPPDPRTANAVVVGGLDAAGRTPAEIDDLVRSKIAAGDQLYELDAEGFRSCDPTHVLTQDLCRVCALPAGDAQDALDHIGCSAEALTLDPHTLHEVLETIADTARFLGVDERGDQVVAVLRSRLADVAASVGESPRPKVFVLEWSDPPFLSGHWVPDLVVAAGGEPVLAEAGGRSVPTDWATIAEQRPDVVVVAPCGFGLDDAADQARQVLDRLPAHGQVWAIDADGLVVRPGPRLVDGVEALAAILHPDLVDGAHPAVRRVR